MPTYEYECSKGHQFEVEQSINDAPLQRCKICRAKVHRLISASHFILKGGGWYADGYGSKKSGGDAKSGESKSETKSRLEVRVEVESKSESKSEPEPAAKSAAARARAKGRQRVGGRGLVTTIASGKAAGRGDPRRRAQARRRSSPAARPACASCWSARTPPPRPTCAARTRRRAPAASSRARSACPRRRAKPSSWR